MCIVIDTNTWPNVFKKQSAKHQEFAPVLNWVTDGPGLVIYGGTRFKKEIFKMVRYLRIIRRLKDSNKMIEIDQKAVDKRELDVIDLTKESDCNDQHIIAIIGISRCRLVCSMDSNSIKHLKNKKLYPKGVPKPKIYSSARNAKELLCQKHIVKLSNVASGWVV